MGQPLFSCLLTIIQKVELAIIEINHGENIKISLLRLGPNHYSQGNKTINPLK